MLERFENFTDEINLLIHRAKKEKYFVNFSIICCQKISIKKSPQNIQKFLSIDEELKLELLSNDGCYIVGFSDRVYLNDVMTRLYQTLSNLLSANKEHIVENNIKLSKSLEEVDSLNCCIIEEFDIDKINQTIEILFENLSKNFPESKVILKIEGKILDLLTGDTKKNLSENKKYKLNLEFREYSKQKKLINIFQLPILLEELENVNLLEEKVVKNLNVKK